MTREQVIKGLECIAEIGECDCNECPYAENGNPARFYKCQAKFASDALELLKEREWQKFEFREPDVEEKKAHPEWIKMLVGGPCDGDEILMSNGRYVWKDQFFVDDCCYLESGCELEDCWWMPLPEPPKEENDG